MCNQRITDCSYTTWQLVSVLPEPQESTRRMHYITNSMKIG